MDSQLLLRVRWTHQRINYRTIHSKSEKYMTIEKLQITLNYEFKLYTNIYKITNKILHTSCDIWNHCISLHRRFYRLYKKHLNKNDLQKHITYLKKLDKFAHWNIVPSQAIQDITDRIQRGYDRFFDYKRNRDKYPHPVQVPKYKKHDEYRSFTLKQAGWDLDQIKGKFKLKDKWYGYFQSKTFDGNVKTVTIKRQYSGVFMYLSTNTEIELPQKSESLAVNLAGFDFSMPKFLISSEGESHEAPLFLKQKLQELDIAMERYKKTKSKKSLKLYQKIHWKVKCQRDYFQWELAHELTDRYDILCFEGLDLQNMDKHYQKKLLDYGLDLFLRKVEHLCKKKRKEYVERDKYFPSSKMCHNCGYINHDLKLSERSWTCQECEHVHDRDINAALNIRDGGSTPEQMVVSTRSHQPSRLFAESHDFSRAE